MNSIVKKMPIPMAGVMLALAVGGNLIGSLSIMAKNLLGMMAFLIFIPLTLKIFINFESIKKGLKHPVMASVMPTYSMGIMALSTYIISVNKDIAFTAFILGIALHFILLLLFTYEFIVNFKIKKVFPSYFIVYVGFVCASVVAPAYNMINLGQWLFYIGLIDYLLLLPIILYRVFVIKGIPDQALPTITIFAAPASLCLAGYMSSFPSKNLNLVYLLMALSITSVIAVILYLPKMMAKGFFPSYAAFTFPFIISGVASLKTLGFFGTLGVQFGLFSFYTQFIRFFSIVITLYVFIHFLRFLRPRKEIVKQEV